MIGILIALGAIGIITDVFFIKTEYTGDMVKATVLKGLASLFFVIIGIICYAQNKPQYGILIVLGLILGMIGDVFLNMRFLYEGKTSNRVFAVGILAFLLGHFMYIAFLIVKAGGGLILALILTAVISAIGVPALMKQVTAPSKGLRIFGVVYLTIVIAMFSFSVAMLYSLGAMPLTITFVIGALLFLASDFIMIYYSFGKKIKPLRAINLFTYYVGQILIATCILMC